MDAGDATGARSHIEFYFDFTCPYAYLASTRIEEIARQGDAELTWRPILLGGVYQATGFREAPPEHEKRQKDRYLDKDLLRWKDRRQVPLRKPAAHPMRSVRALRALLSLPEERWPPVIHEMYRAYWQRNDDITSAEIVAQVLERAGVGGELAARAIAANDDQVIKDDLRRRTEEAIARGVFGVPAMFVRVPGEPEPYMFWGQDRLHLVRAVLAGWRPGQTASAPYRGNDLADPAALARFPERAAPGQARARVLFYYDFSSPFAYLASTQIEDLAARAGAELVWRPMLLGALFRQVASPDVPLMAMAESKRRYTYRDLEHWAAYWGVPFGFASRFPQRSVTALRLVLLAGERIAEVSHALFRIPWVDDGDIDDHDTLARALEECGFPAGEMLARTRDADVKQRLFDATAEAAARGVFGAPTCFVDTGDGRGELMFWGQDRLALVGDALRGWRPDGE